MLAHVQMSVEMTGTSPSCSPFQNLSRVFLLTLPRSLEERRRADEYLASGRIPQGTAIVLELGPILRFESRRVARRKGWYVLRVVFVLAVLGVLAVFHQAFLFNVRLGVPPDFAKRFLATTLVRFVAILHLIIAFLIAPIEAASAFNRVRVRSMLSKLLVTEISPRRIVWETFAACLMPGICIWLCLVPMAAIVIPGGALIQS